jgi:DNA recombination protein RmuC
MPDVVVMLPEGKHIIIDSKVSLVAYDRMVNADTEEEQARQMALHVQSVKAHIKGLSDKNYPGAKGINSPDFVLLFMPIESSFSQAIKADDELFNFAWERNIVIVGPSTLLATLRTISAIWRQEQQSRNALLIAEKGAAMYDKFVGFVEDLKRIGKNIEGTQKSYDEAFKKLSEGSGNLVRRAEEMRKLGAKGSKQLPQDIFGDDDQA